MTQERFISEVRQQQEPFQLFLQDYRQYLLPGVAVLATGLSLVVGRKASNS